MGPPANRRAAMNQGYRANAGASYTGFGQGSWLSSVYALQQLAVCANRTRCRTPLARAPNPSSLAISSKGRPSQPIRADGRAATTRLVHGHSGRIASRSLQGDKRMWMPRSPAAHAAGYARYRTRCRTTRASQTPVVVVVTSAALFVGRSSKVAEPTDAQMAGHRPREWRYSNRP